MDLSDITRLISSLRAQTARDSITPNGLGSILQRIVDAISSMSGIDVEDENAILQRLSAAESNASTALQAAQSAQAGAANNVIDSFTPSQDEDEVSLSLKQHGYNAKQVVLPVASSTGAGIMTATDKSHLDTAYGKRINLMSAPSSESVVTLTITFGDGTTKSVTFVGATAGTGGKAGMMTKEQADQLAALVASGPAESVRDDAGYLKQQYAAPIILRNVNDTIFDDLAIGDVYYDSGHLFYHAEGESGDPDIGAPSRKVIYYCLADQMLYRWTGSRFVQAVSISSGGVTVPTKLSDLINDMGFLTAHQPLKTINGETITGTGNITIDGAAELKDASNHIKQSMATPVVLRNVTATVFDDLNEGDTYFDSGHLFYHTEDQSGDQDIGAPSRKVIYYCLADGKMYRWNGNTFQPILATVATSGNYNDLSNKPTIPDVSNLATKAEVSTKQDAIPDLANIRSGAGKGATAIQGIIVGGSEVTPDANRKVTIPAGADGKSAYQSYLDTTSDSPKMSEAEWVASLKGEKGDAGNVHVTDGVADIDIVNDLSTGGVSDALSAEMGLRLKSNIDAVQANIVKLYEKLANMAFWDSTDHGDAEPTALDWSIPKVTATITNSIGANAVIKKNGSVVGSSVQVDQGSTLVLTIEAASGYELSNVAATIGGVAQTLTENNGVYTLSIDHVNSSITIAITGSASMLWHTMAKTNVEDGNGNVVEYGIQQGRSINPTTLDVVGGLNGSTPLVVLAPLGNPTDQYVMTTNTDYAGPGNSEPYFIPTFGKRYLHFKMSGGTLSSGQVPKICIACYKESIVDGFSYSQANVQSRGITRIPYAAANNGDMQWKVDLFDAVNNPTGSGAGSPVAGDIKFVKILICVYPNSTSTNAVDSRTWFDNFSFAYKITDD